MAGTPPCGPALVLAGSAGKRCSYHRAMRSAVSSFFDERGPARSTSAGPAGRSLVLAVVAGSEDAPLTEVRTGKAARPVKKKRGGDVRFFRWRPEVKKISRMLMLFVGAQLLLKRDHPLVFKIFAGEIDASRCNNSTFDVAPKYPMPTLGSSLHYCWRLLSFIKNRIAKKQKNRSDKAKLSAKRGRKATDLCILQDSRAAEEDLYIHSAARFFCF